MFKLALSTTTFSKQESLKKNSKKQKKQKNKIDLICFSLLQTFNMVGRKSLWIVIILIFIFLAYTNKFQIIELIKKQISTNYSNGNFKNFCYWF